MEQWNIALQDKYKTISEKEQRFELYKCDDAEIIIVAYGSVARIAKNVVQVAREEGIKVGLLRPITLWPFPTKAFEQVIDKPNAFLTVEMSSGQMLEDVMLAVKGRKPVHFTGRMGGMIPKVDDIMAKIREIRAD